MPNHICVWGIKTISFRWVERERGWNLGKRKAWATSPQDLWNAGRNFPFNLCCFPSNLWHFLVCSCKLWSLLLSSCATLCVHVCTRVCLSVFIWLSSFKDVSHIGWKFALFPYDLILTNCICYNSFLKDGPILRPWELVPQYITSRGNTI